MTERNVIVKGLGENIQDGGRWKAEFQHPPANRESTMPRASDALEPGASPWHLFGAELRHWRELRGLTQRELAKAAYVDNGDLSKWERGVAHPQADAAERLDTETDASGILIALHALAGRMQQTDREINHLREHVAPRPPLSADGISVVHSSIAGLAGVGEDRLGNRNPSRWDEDDDMQRRAAMKLLGALAAGATIPAGSLEAALAGVERSLGIRDEFDLDEWERTVWEYGQLYYSQPPGAMVSDLAADLVEVTGLLNRSRPPVQAGLHQVCARLSALMATDWSDAGQQRAARLSSRTARRAADAARDQSLSVWVRAREADAAFWQATPSPIVSNMVAGAIRDATGAASVGLAYAYEVRAKLLAAQGARDDARAALHDLLDCYEQLPDHATSERALGCSIGTSYPEASVLRTTALVYAFLGDKAEARRAVDQALANLPRGLAGGNLRLIQALVQIHDGDVDEGVSRAVEIAKGVPQLTPQRRLIVGKIADAVPASAAALPAAQELRALTRA
ncbi:helix-turn-helix domain-containing protein [Nonomuraea sp. 10N515B]|uniref:helix-turn-helix domain-containing protein n=1 Tax=Nonomuraea sp. 10N515B TaxID=3457422 RepID=UPI003FCD453F